MQQTNLRVHISVWFIAGYFCKKRCTLLHKSVVLPKALYGCECMNTFTDSEKLILKWAYNIGHA